MESKQYIMYYTHKVYKINPSTDHLRLPSAGLLRQKLMHYRRMDLPSLLDNDTLLHN